MAITQAILPVAGLGTRFLPWTKVVPKELLPIGNEPIIAHVVDECLDAGITDICFVINKGKEAIPEYFYENPELETELARRGKLEQLEHLKKYDQANFHVVYQREQLGDGHAIMQATDWIKSDAVAVLFGDDLFTGGNTGLQQLIDAYDKLAHDEKGAVLALEDIDPQDTHKYGIVEIAEPHSADPQLKKLKGMVEKPDPTDAPSTLGIVGRYVIPRSTFDVLPDVAAGHGGEIRLIDALIAQLQELPIFGVQCTGTRIDTGTPEGYMHALKTMGHA